MVKATFREWNHDGSKVIAFADVDVSEGIIVRGFKIINGQKGVFAAVPTKAHVINGETRYINQVLFGDPERRKRFLEEVMEAYRGWKGERRAETETTSASG